MKSGTNTRSIEPEEALALIQLGQKLGEAPVDSMR